MDEKIRRARPMRGQAAVAFLCMATLALIALSFAFEFTQAFSARQGMDADLEGAQEAVMAAGDYIKNADPARADGASDAVAQTVFFYYQGIAEAGALKAGKLTVEIDVVEAPESMTGATDRMIGVAITAKRKLEAPLAGIPSFEVAAQRAFAIHPYSSVAIQRPPANSDAWHGSTAVYTTADSGTSTQPALSTRRGPYDKAPEAAREAIEQALTTDVVSGR